MGTLGVSGQLLAGEFVRRVAREVVAAAAQSFPANLELSIKLLVDESDDRVRFQDVLCEAASLWIPKADKYGSGEIRNRLQRFFLKYLGDPRWPGERMKWDRVSEEARRIITRWLAREDITFFFDVLSRAVEHHAWEYRREFWEAYLPHIDATWVILSPDVEAVIGKQVEERIASVACGEFTGSNQGRSMLAIEMKGWVFVEWTHAGSCRIWPKQEFPLALGKRYYRVNEVNSILLTCLEFFPHHGSENYRWQAKLSVWLKNNLGLPMELFKDEDYRRAFPWLKESSAGKLWTMVSCLSTGAHRDPCLHGIALSWIQVIPLRCSCLSKWLMKDGVAPMMAAYWSCMKR